jgi:hypothetical protein
VSIADRYRFFAEVETPDDSPIYSELSAAIAEDEELLQLLKPLRVDPILVFGSINYLGGIDPDYGTFRRFIVDHAEDLRRMVATRTTQTNEVGRCALFVPAIGTIAGPVALVEVGTSAGLNLMMDRYCYDYGEAGRVGDGDVVLRCEARGSVPVPERLPEIVFRKGIDIAPVDVNDDDSVRWLEACVWPGRPERLENLRGAIELVRRDPPEVVRGDLVDDLEAVLDEAPNDATTVVFHSMVLSYVSEEKRARFEEIVRSRDVVWFSFEAPWMVPGVRWSERPPPTYAAFLGRGGTELLAYAHPHGRWIDWL